VLLFFLRKEGVHAKGWINGHEEWLTLFFPPPCDPSNALICAYGCSRQGLTRFTQILTKRDRGSSVRTRPLLVVLTAPLASSRPWGPFVVTGEDQPPGLARLWCNGVFLIKVLLIFSFYKVNIFCEHNYY